MPSNPLIRNVAIIAHVDHGKTTLVDAMLRQSGIFRKNEDVVERVMDSNDLERERGITILAKATGIRYHGHQDQHRRHARPQRFRRRSGARAQDRRRRDAAGGRERRPAAANPLRADEGAGGEAAAHRGDQQDRPPRRAHSGSAQRNLRSVHRSGRDRRSARFSGDLHQRQGGIAKTDPDGEETDLRALFEAILQHIPAPQGDPDGVLQLLVANLDYSDYLGRLAIGRVFNGTLRHGDEVAIAKLDGTFHKTKITKLYSFEGLKRVDETIGSPGDILAIAGVEGITIGETVTSAENPQPLAHIQIDEPTIAMTFTINTSPFSGREGQYVTSRNLRDRLDKELLTNVSIRVEEAGGPDAFKVMGRGELQLAILIEMMRREGFELAVGKPEILTKTIDGKLCEPLELLVIDCPEEFIGVVIEKLGRRKGKMEKMVNHGSGRVRLEFQVPSRGLIGLRSEMLTDTRGTAIMNSLFQRLHRMAGRNPHAPHRIAGRRPRRQDHRPRDFQPAGARRNVRLPGHRSLRRDDRRRERPRRRPEREHRQGKEAHQHARLHRR